MLLDGPWVISTGLFSAKPTCGNWLVTQASGASVRRKAGCSCGTLEGGSQGTARKSSPGLPKALISLAGIRGIGR